MRKIGVPYCPHCKGKIVSVAIVEQHYPITKIDYDSKDKCCQMETGDMENSYESDSFYQCEDCEKKIPISKMIIRKE